MGLLRNWADKKLKEWEKNSEQNKIKKENEKEEKRIVQEKEEEEKRIVQEKEEQLRGDLEILLDKFDMPNLKDFCKNYLGTEPPEEMEEDKKTGRFRKITPDRHTFLNFILDYFDTGQLRATQIQDFAVKRKIVTQSFVSEESDEKSEQSEFSNILNTIRAEFEAENIADEHGLEDQLVVFLKAKYPGRQIERQQKTASQGRVDILVDKKYVFELKVPRARGDLRGLYGQLDEYSEDYDHVCAVIAEDVKEQLGQTIKDYVDKYRSKLDVPSIVKEVKKR